MEDFNEDVKAKLDYWKSFWGFHSDYIPNDSEALLITPNMLLTEIIIEIENNGFQNIDNKNLFYKYLNFFMKDDPVISKFYKNEFLYLRKNYNSSKNEYIRQLCISLLKKFREGIYAKLIIQRLVESLLSNKNLEAEKKNIQYLTNSIIFEFLYKGYSTKTISKIIQNIFAQYYIVENNRIITDFPINLSLKSFPTEKDFYTEIQRVMDALTIKERLNKLHFYNEMKPKDNRFIFYVRGLKLNEEITLGDVTFYNPFQKNYVNDDDPIFEEHFSRNEANYFCNALVKINFLDDESGKVEALNKIQNAFSIIRSQLRFKEILEVDSTRYIIINESNNSIGGGSSLDKKEERFMWDYALDLKDWRNHLENSTTKKISDIIFKDNRLRTFQENALFNSLHWFRKAEESNAKEDKLINYWIGLENLFYFHNNAAKIVDKEMAETKIKLMSEIISTIVAYTSRYKIAWDLFWLLRYEYFLLVYRHHPKLPNHLKITEILKPVEGKNIEIVQFLNELNTLDGIVKNNFLIEEINYVKQIYLSESKGYDKLKDLKSKIKEEIIYIYRLRNLFVHNAQFDNPILSYYVNRLQKISSNVINTIINESNFVGNFIENSLIKSYTEANLFIENSKEKKLVALL